MERSRAFSSHQRRRTMSLPTVKTLAITVEERHGDMLTNGASNGLGIFGCRTFSADGEGALCCSLWGPDLGVRLSKEAAYWDGGKECSQCWKMDRLRQWYVADLIDDMMSRSTNVSTRRPSSNGLRVYRPLHCFRTMVTPARPTQVFDPVSFASQAACETVRLRSPLY